MGKFSSLTAVQGLSGLGTAFQAFNIISSAKEAKENAQFNAREARNEAELIKQQTKIQQDQIRRQGARDRARIKVRAGKGGVVSGVGSPLLTQLEIVALEETDILNLGFTGASAVRSKLLEAQQQERRGKFAVASGISQFGSLVTKNLKPKNFTSVKPKRKKPKSKLGSERKTVEELTGEDNLGNVLNP